MKILKNISNIPPFGEKTTEGISQQLGGKSPTPTGGEAPCFHLGVSFQRAEKQGRVWHGISQVAGKWERRYRLVSTTSL